MHQKIRSKRNKAVMAFLFPMLVSIGIMGWCMNVLGKPGASYKVKDKECQKKDNVAFLPIILEETHELVNQ